MTRSEALAVIQSTLPKLDEDRLTVVAELLQTWSAPTVYSTLAPAERADIDAALDRLDEHRSVPAETVFEKIAERLHAART